MAALARQSTANVSRSRFVNFSAQRNQALARCRGDWVFFIDPDERATPALVAELRALLADPAGLGGAWAPRRNFMFGHEVRHAGWAPDYQLRLLAPRRGALRREPGGA